MASNVREERRRKIMERGSDRLALITGQIPNLSESPSSTPTYRAAHHAHTESSPSVMNSPKNYSQFNDSPRGLESLDSASAAKLLKLRTIGAIPESNNYDSPKLSESRFRSESRTIDSPKLSDSQFQKIEASSNKPIHDISETNSEIQEYSEIQTRQSVPPAVSNVPNYSHNYFSSRRINACIVASERTRAICSLLIAFLVVTSYVDYPVFGIIVSSESFIASRPMYIILFTDLTIVLARLFFEHDFGSDEVEGERNKDDGDTWDGAVKLLERGLVLYQAIRGIFIDCSVYLVVVICGLSLV